MSMNIVIQLGHSGYELEVLRRGALLHDIGKFCRSGQAARQSRETPRR